MAVISPVEVIDMNAIYKIQDIYYVPVLFEGKAVTISTVRESVLHSETTIEIIEMIDAAIAAGDLTEDAMEALGVAVARQQKADENKQKADYEASLTYADRRRAAYAPLAVQLDMQYWDQVNGTMTWINHVAEVKARFPKPQ